MSGKDVDIADKHQKEQDLNRDLPFQQRRGAPRGPICGARPGLHPRRKNADECKKETGGSKFKLVRCGEESLAQLLSFISSPKRS